LARRHDFDLALLGLCLLGRLQPGLLTLSALLRTAGLSAHTLLAQRRRRRHRNIFSARLRSALLFSHYQFLLDLK